MELEGIDYGWPAWACSIFFLTPFRFSVSSACNIFNLSNWSFSSSDSSLRSSKSLSSDSLPRRPQFWRSFWLSILSASLACLVLDKMSRFWNKMNKANHQKCAVTVDFNYQLQGSSASQLDVSCSYKRTIFIMFKQL